ncbi:helix-turn-helix transcriptional regulator [Algoriphagus terrigena]|uniref:helix-turn-helix transcriptional regulator n=1 Tax=Algoriphagus terrigena TaxID=344884 RepID=UPI0004005C60|nr:helix-turn-helix transcriptional regulator [Algoriphagus terrigena]
MSIGSNIKGLRIQKELSTKSISEEIGISEEKYVEIENGGDFLFSVLEAIANRLSTTVTDLILLDEAPAGIKNYFNNNNGNQGRIINVQGIDQEEIRRAYKELYFEQVKRIPKLEKLLIENNIPFDF